MSDPSACKKLQADQTLKPRVYVVNQRPQPSTPAPLGWVLSVPSQKEMTEDLEYQENTQAASVSRQYGTLKDLLIALGIDG